MSDPQATTDRRRAARHLVQHPLTTAEGHPELFRLIRRHERELDRWFTQRLGYRLHLSADTARLYKTAVVPEGRPLLTAKTQPRPLRRREYVYLALILAAVAAGPRVISLRDLVERVRSAAAEAEVTISEDASERRALINAMEWLIATGVAVELHERVARYATEDDADAVIGVDPDRVALLPLPALASAATAAELVDRSDRRAVSRQWMRAWLVEEPVLLRDDLDDHEWVELRRRLGEETDLLDEMFGLIVEARAEGVAAIDPDGDLSDRPFPTTRTVGHAALLLIERLAGHDRPVTMGEVTAAVADLAGRYRRYWAKVADDPGRLAVEAVDLLAAVRLARRNGDLVELLPPAHRYLVDAEVIDAGGNGDPVDEPGVGEDDERAAPGPAAGRGRSW
jgi:uncharacterized protein (TIGR02678 family)